MSSPEGHYESISEVREYLSLAKRVEKELMTLTYHFSSESSEDLLAFIDSIKNDQFRNCDSKFIDIIEDEEDIGRYSIVVSRKVKSDAEVLWTDYIKYGLKCKDANINYGGICVSD